MGVYIKDINNCNEYTEIFKLKEMLDKASIPYKFHKMNFHIPCEKQGYRIAYPSLESTICSVIEHIYSIGQKEDLLEIRGLLTSEEYQEDDVKGYLTAEEVFERIKEHYEQNKKG